MEKYAILVGFFEKQIPKIDRLFDEITTIDVMSYPHRYEFALKTQQFFTALEDLFKQIAKTFENNIDVLATYHKSLLLSVNRDIPNVRPAAISDTSFVLLDKVYVFRQSIWHAYDCALDESELKAIQCKIKSGYPGVLSDLMTFKAYVKSLA